jgi:hypothetical protein
VPRRRGELADAGSALVARTRLLSAADHALIALSAHSAVGVSQAGAQLDRPAIALRLAELGATPDDLLPSRLTPGFGLVHALIDASLTHQVSPPAPTAPAPMPMRGAAFSRASRRSGVETSEKPKPVAPPMNEAMTTTSPLASSCHGSTTRG